MRATRFSRAAAEGSTFQDLEDLARTLAAWIREIPERRRAGSDVSRVVAITGPPGIGKTTTCMRLREIDDDVAVVHLDEFLRERTFRREKRLSPFDLRAWEHERALADLKAMFFFGAIRIRPYSVKGGEHGEACDVFLRRTVLLDGTLAALSDDVRQLADATVVFTADPETIRALRRDRDQRHGRVDEHDEAERWLAEWPTLRDNILPVTDLANIAVETSHLRLYRVREVAPVRHATHRSA